MDFERQKPVTEQYRENYDKVFRRYDLEDSIREYDSRYGKFHPSQSYPNGCPMIEESNA